MLKCPKCGKEFFTEVDDNETVLLCLECMSTFNCEDELIEEG